VVEVVTWALDCDLFVIINAHHEDWLVDQCNANHRKMFRNIWRKIAARFQGYSNRLFFEVLNEARPPMDAGACNDVNAEVLSIIRETNPTRLVLLGGPQWNGHKAVTSLAVPRDPYVMINFHYYSPHSFTHGDQPTWGFRADDAVDQVAWDLVWNDIKSVAEWGQSHNVPLFCGEFGVMQNNPDKAKKKDRAVQCWYKAVTEALVHYGIPFTVWDDGGWFRIFDRHEKTFQSSRVHATIMAVNPSPPVNAVTG